MKNKVLSESRVDVMVDIESLSMETGGTMIQLCAKKFHIRTGKVLETFNMYVDISKELEVVTTGDTLKWWMLDKGRAEVFKDILEKGKYSEEEVMTKFHAWLGTGDICLWGNGILDDNRVLDEKFRKYGLTSPIKFDNHRDVRTLVELACMKENVSRHTFIGKNMIKGNGKVHNALNDVDFQIKLVVSAVDTLLKLY